MASADAEHKAAYATATSVPDVNLTSAVLMAGARHLGQFCGSENEAFLQCKFDNEGNPVKCIDQGVKVTKCTLNFFKKLREACGPEFTAQWKCLDANNQTFEHCRSTQAAMDECVFSKLGLEGAFRTFDTPRSFSSYSKHE